MLSKSSNQMGKSKGRSLNKNSKIETRTRRRINCKCRRWRSARKSKFGRLTISCFRAASSRSLSKLVTFTRRIYPSAKCSRSSNTTKGCPLWIWSERCRKGGASSMPALWGLPSIPTLLSSITGFLKFINWEY